jgi:hypothetical protein
MSNIDFQNGFIVGYTSGKSGAGGGSYSITTEINENSTDEQVPSALSVYKYTDYKITSAHEHIYSYSKDNLSKIKTHYASIPVFEMKTFKGTDVDLYTVKGSITLLGFEMDPVNGIHNFVKYPFELVENSDRELTFKGLEYITDVAIMIGSPENTFTFSGILEDTVDGSTFTDGNISITPVHHQFSTDAYADGFNVTITIYSPYEQAIAVLVEEFSQYLQMATHTLVYYKDQRLKVIEGG